MIIEMRTYTLQPGTVATFEERFGQALPARAKVSPLAAFWHTEVGPLNRVIHVWPYDDLGGAHPAARRGDKAAGLAAQCPGIRSRAAERHLSPGAVLAGARAAPARQSLRDPHLHLQAGRHPRRDRPLERPIARRTKLSPLVGAWHSELGGLNKWCHIWAYKDAADRFRIREEARAKGIWPPPSGGRAEHDDQAGKHAGRPRRLLAAALTVAGLLPPPTPSSVCGEGRGRGVVVTLGLTLRA